MAHQYGFTETVAALGTAFTAAQLGRAAPLLPTRSSRSSMPTPPAARPPSGPRSCWSRPADGQAWASDRAGRVRGDRVLRASRSPLLPGRPRPRHLPARRGRRRVHARASPRARSLLSFALDRALSEADDRRQPRGPRHRPCARGADAVEGRRRRGGHRARRARRRCSSASMPTQLWIEAQRLQGRAAAEPAAAAARADRQLPPGRPASRRDLRRAPACVPRGPGRAPARARATRT